MPSYKPLHSFLQGRYADRLVLTFGQMEDLLGFPLPHEARTDQSWWAAGATPDEHTDAWLKADRSAVVNLTAATVLFERTAIPAGRQPR